MVNAWFCRVEDGLEVVLGADGLDVVEMAKGVADSLEMEQMRNGLVFDHLYISRRNRQNYRFRVYNFIRRSFFTNTILYVYQF